jgi:flavin-dependent dehydrogenase
MSGAGGGAVGSGVEGGLDERLWDVAVVGAGPAGAMVALQLARRGRSVLLLDRQQFPRWKVCGACMNGAAQAALARAGLDELVPRARAPRLTELRLTGWGRKASVALQGSVALSREALDQALVRTAVEDGVVLAAGVSAELGSVSDGARTLTVRDGGEERSVRARIVIAAAGLNGLRASAGAGPSPVIRARAGSRVGLGAVLEGGGAGYGPGAVHMVVGSAGYVGLVRQEDHRLNVAAAFDADWVRHHGSPEHAVRAHLESAGMPAIPEKVHRGWKGTPPLTRRVSTLGEERLLFVGDAAGYVEPFTGEGMAWALWGALALAPLVCAGVARWDPALVPRWTRLHRRRIRRGQWVCGMVAWGLRHPWMAQTALRALGAVPAMARPLVKHTSAVAYLRGGGAW